MTTPPRGGRRDLTAFYLVVVLIALAGQALAAVEWLGWPLIPAVLAVAALELGGVVLSRHALQRMQLGERAIASRVLSASVALFAVAFNWAGHADHRQGAFFAGMSALGYLVWLLDSAARRRDQLRTLGMLAVPPPAYGAAQWIRHPWLTREARALAVETPSLGLHGSIAAAVTARRVAQRTSAIAKVLHRKIRAAVDPTTADIAVAVYDLDEVAARLAAAADYDGITALIGADLVPSRIAGGADNSADMAVDKTSAADTTAAPSGAPAEQGLNTADATLVAQSMYVANPDIDVAIIARLVGRSVRTVRRYLVPVGGPASTPPADVAAPQPPTRIWSRPGGLDEVLDRTTHITDPAERRRAIETALFGPDTETTAAIAAA